MCPRGRRRLISGLPIFGTQRHTCDQLAGQEQIEPVQAFVLDTKIQVDHNVSALPIVCTREYHRRLQERKLSTCGVLRANPERVLSARLASLHQDD